MHDLELLQLAPVALQVGERVAQHLDGNLGLDLLAEQAQRLGAGLGRRRQAVEARMDDRLHPLRREIGRVRALGAGR